MQYLTYTFHSSPVKPPIIGQRGDPVVCELAPQYASLSINHTPYVQGTIASITQVGTTWTYVISIQDSQLAPGTAAAGKFTGTLSGFNAPERVLLNTMRYIQAMAANLAGSVAALAAQDEFSRVILDPTQEIVPGTFHVGFLPRNLLLKEGIRISWPVAGIAPVDGNANQGYFSIRLQCGGVDLLAPSVIKLAWNINTTVIPMTNISTAGKGVLLSGARLTCIISGITGDGGYGNYARGLEIAYRGVWQP